MSTKTVQGRLWSVAPHFWANHFEPWFSPMYRKVLQQLDLNEDHLLLDAGCGSGLFSHLAIKTGAQVIGVDAAPGLLELARRRNPLHSFLEEDIEALPFIGNSFHFVTGFNSFQYAGNFERALSEAKRVLKPGGRMVIAIWDKPDMSDATDVLKSIGALLPPPPPGTPGPFALSEDGKIEKVFANNDMKVVYKTRVACPFLFDSLSDGIKCFMGTGPAAAAMHHCSRQTVEQAIAKALEPFGLVDEFIFLQNHFLVFIAEK